MDSREKSPLMKNAKFTLSLVLLLWGCSQNTDSATSPSVDGASNADLKQTPSEANGSYLTIHGKDIWLRDSSSTGPVIMKLNEGDRCLIVERGDWVRIKESVDYWYHIRFQGKEGWVFGSQTDQKMTTMGQGVSPRQAWEDMRTRFKQKEITYPELEPDHCENMYYFKESGDSTFSVGFACEEISDTTFTFNGDSLKNLRFFSGSTMYGAAYGCFDGYTPYCINFGGLWVVPDPFVGDCYGQARLPDSSYLFLMVQNHACGFWGNQSVNVYQWFPDALEMKLVQNLLTGEYGTMMGSGEDVEPGTYFVQLQMKVDGLFPQIEMKFNEDEKLKKMHWDDHQHIFIE